MSVRDINPDSVLAAINAGYDDIDKLAQHFGVLHVSHTLRSTITELVEADRLVIEKVGGWSSATRYAVA